MEDTNLSEDALFELLTLERLEVPAQSPPYYGYHVSWGYQWTRPWPGVDIVFKNKAGKLHRIYGPAYLSHDRNTEIWYKEGEYHRTNCGPALRHADYLAWYKDGKRHRLDGPAIINPAGPKEYWINGEKYSPKQYRWEIRRRKVKGLIK